MKKILLALQLIPVFAFVAFSQTPSRIASATWHVQKYDLNVTLPQDERTRSIAARAALELRNVSGSPANTLTFRISSVAEVSSVRINDAVVDFSKSEEKISSVTSLQRIAVRVGSIPPGGNVSALVDYKLTIKDNSSLSSISPVGAQLLPLSFWYPTPNSWFFALGADAAPMRIKVSPASGHSVVSSGAETAGVFEQKLNSQLFFLTGNWDQSEQNGVRIYLPKGTLAEAQKRAAELALLMSEARTYVAGLLGDAPATPLRIVASRRGAGFSSGGTVLVDEAIFRRSKIDSLTAMNVTEAVVKIWLGGAIFVHGEGYGSISEGLARYIATQFIESKYGKDVADVERLRQRTSYAAVSKRDGPISMVSPLDDVYYSVVANKGAMAWRLLAHRFGNAEFLNVIRRNSRDGELNLGELRAAFSAQKEIVDYLFDQVTDMNLLVGLPQNVGGETRVNLRNTGSIDATVDIVATTVDGQKLTVSTNIKPRSFGEVTFRTLQKVERVEIDGEKIYPQIDYLDDIAPRERNESDPLLATKRLFDKQDFAGVEAISRPILRDRSKFDEVRIYLARALLAQNKLAEAEKEFRWVLDERLPTSKSIAWANVGLAEIASRRGQTSDALKFAETAIIVDADYGASLAARNLRNKIGGATATDQSIKTFFADFDKAATANRKADIDALVMPGEVTRFAAGVAGSTEQWQTQVRAVDRLDSNTVLVETALSIKLLNKDVESGMAVYRLIRVGQGWKLAAVEMFEVR